MSLDSLGAEGNSASNEPSVSAGGRYIAFASEASNLVPGDSNGTKDVFVHDRLSGVTERVSMNSLGVEGNNESLSPSISADGRYVAFSSKAKNFVPGDLSGGYDIFVRDRMTDTTERVSVDSLGVAGSGWSLNPSISADGRYVAFRSSADNLVIGDTNDSFDIFVHDRQTGLTERVSVDSLGAGGNGWSYDPAISADGQSVAFYSSASNLVPGDTNMEDDVFVHDRANSMTVRVSVDSLGAEGNDRSRYPAISADGQHVVFSSRATNIVPGNSVQDIFIHDRQTGVTKRVSVNLQGVEGNGYSESPAVSSDGRYVAFWSFANNLAPRGSTVGQNIFVHDCWTGATEIISLDSQGVGGNRASHAPSISGDGRVVTFWSYADNLVPGDTNGVEDVFSHDRWNGLGANSIYLSAPLTAPVGVPMNFTWFTAKPNSNFWLAYSLNTNGGLVGGHSIDIGTPQSILASGLNSGNGTGSFTSPPIPVGVIGLTIHFEVVARDAGGTLYDSNALAVSFF